MGKNILSTGNFLPAMRHVKTLRKTYEQGYVNNLLLITLIVNIVIPKAGFKFNDIPITIGNILFAFLVVINIISILKEKFSFNEIIIGGGIVYWLLRFLICLCSNYNNTDNLIAYFTTLVIYPAMYFIIKRYFITQNQVDKIIALIDKCLFIVMIYAIIQFIFGIENTAIPGITVNYTDYIRSPDSWWLDKANGFLGGSKIFSTYQNGNIFGLALLLLFPISYRSTNKYSRFKLLLFIICCFLSGSRSTIIGCILYLIIIVVRKRKIAKKTFILGTLFLAAAIPVFIKIITLNSNLGLLNRIGNSLNWQVLVNGAGRTANAVEYFSWLFNKFRPFAFLFGAYGSDYSGGAYEMTYICVFLLGGIIGLILFIYPVFNIVSRIKRKLLANDNEKLRGVYEGIILYFLIAFIEGAYWLPPTALNVWSVISLAQVMMNISNIDVIERT